MNTSKNYKTDNGDKWVIGGTLEVSAGASVTGITTATLVNNLASTDAAKALTAAQGKVLNDAKLTASKAANQAASVAADVPALLADFNALLTKLKAAGIMTAD